MKCSVLDSFAIERVPPLGITHHTNTYSHFLFSATFIVHLFSVLCYFFAVLSLFSFDTLKSTLSAKRFVRVSFLKKYSFYHQISNSYHQNIVKTANTNWARYVLINFARDIANV